MSTTHLDQVNLFVGTAGDHGQLYPGVERPFGYVKLSPDTFPGAVTGTAHGGYDYNDRRILGFSHLRFSGVGCEGVGGNVLLLPTLNGNAWDPDEYALPYAKDSETAEPGYYSAVLGEPGIHAELTASNHVGCHRYTFPDEGVPHVLIDLGRGFTPVRDAHCVVLNNREIAGELTANQMYSCGWYRVFFVIRFDQDFDGAQIRPQNRDTALVGRNGPNGALAALCRFPRLNGTPLHVQVALSPISIEDARESLKHETPEWDFDGVRKACRAAWAECLGRIDVSGPSEYEALFYTHLYRSCLSPFDATSPKNRYMGVDGQVHTADGYTHYDGWSLWDTYRTKFPLLTLTEPARMRDMAASLTNMLTRRRTQVPWDIFFDGHGFSAVPTTRIELANVILADAHQKGIRLVDPEATYAVMADIARMEFAGERDRLGYVPRSPAVTCEYAYDNWAAAEMAKALGREADHAEFAQRATYHRNVWDPDLRFLRARDEAGNWLEFPQDPTDVDETYIYEGSMWHWRWAVVHDVPDLVRLMGGHDRFIADLTYFFENDLHNQGNEPGIHAPWMFAAAGAPWLSQQWVRTILTEPMRHRFGTHNLLRRPYEGVCFRNTPDGLIPEMDDDDGCMAAWYVFSAMGLFPVCVGRPYYAVGMPLFEETVIHSASGRDLRIAVKNWAPNHWYIQSASLNGEAFARPWIGHQEIVEGGELVFEAGPDPCPGWGADRALPW